jgi:metal-responsive CopG/Arc/MetJ family transcriptional regulator
MQIRVELEGTLAEDTEFLMKNRGLKNRSELVRQLIVEARKREAS